MIIVLTIYILSFIFCYFTLRHYNIKNNNPFEVEDIFITITPFINTLVFVILSVELMEKRIDNTDLPDLFFRVGKYKKK